MVKTPGLLWNYYRHTASWTLHHYSNQNTWSKNGYFSKYNIFVFILLVINFESNQIETFVFESGKKY